MNPRVRPWPSVLARRLGVGAAQHQPRRDAGAAAGSAAQQMLGHGLTATMRLDRLGR